MIVCHLITWLSRVYSIFSSFRFACLWHCCLVPMSSDNVFLVLAVLGLSLFGFFVGENGLALLMKPVTSWASGRSEPEKQTLERRGQKNLQNT